MAQPTGVASGTVPQKSSTRRVLLLKRLGELQNRAGALAANDPKPGNACRQLQVKIDRAIAAGSAPA